MTGSTLHRLIREGIPELPPWLEGNPDGSQAESTRNYKTALEVLRRSVLNPNAILEADPDLVTLIAALGDGRKSATIRQRTRRNILRAYCYECERSAGSFAEGMGSIEFDIETFCSDGADVRDAQQVLREWLFNNEWSQSRSQRSQSVNTRYQSGSAHKALKKLFPSDSSFSLTASLRWIEAMRRWSGNESSWSRIGNLQDDPWLEQFPTTLRVKDVGQYCVPYVLWAATRERQRCPGNIVPRKSQMWNRKPPEDTIDMSLANENDLEPPEVSTIIKDWMLSKASSGKRFAPVLQPALAITPLWSCEKENNKVGYWFENNNRLYFRLPSIQPEPAWVNIYVATADGGRLEVYADEDEDDEVSFIEPKFSDKEEMAVLDKTTVKWVGFTPIENGKNLVLVVIVDQPKQH